MASNERKCKSRKDVWTLEENARKKRKVEREDKTRDQEGKDEWDDSLELTQADIDTLDVIASQAIVQDGPDAVHEHDRTNTAVTFPTEEDGLYFAKPASVIPYTSRRSTSSSSSSSVHPSSLTSRSASDTSSSLSSHTSENGKTETPAGTMQSLQAQLDQERQRAQEEKYRTAGEMAFLRESLRKQEEELEKVRAERDVKLEQNRQIQKEAEKVMQAKIESAAAQAQFKEQEFKNLQEQYQALQNKLKRLEQERSQSSTSLELRSSPSKPASPRKIPVRASPPSKQKIKQTEVSGFPTHQSFMQQAMVTAGSSGGLASASSHFTSAETSKRKKDRRLKLKVSSGCVYLDQSKCNGTQIVQHLMASTNVYHPALTARNSETVHSVGESWDPGLLGLMHALSTKLRVSGLTYNRSPGKGSNSLLPVTPKGHALKRLCRENDTDTINVVNKENFQLALEGLLQLLDDGAQGQNTSIRDQTSLKSQEGSEAGITAHCSLTPTSKIQASAVKILPLLTDYIQHYMDLLACNPAARGSTGLGRAQQSAVSPYYTSVESSSATTSTTPTSSSLDSSSLDSLNSNIIQLLHEGQVYAAGVEGYAGTAIRCIVLLLMLCPALVNNILEPAMKSVGVASSFRVSSVSGNSSVGEGNVRSEVEGDDEKSTSSCEYHILPTAIAEQKFTPNLRPRSNVQSPILFQLLLKMVGQDLSESSCDPVLMAQALHILTLLCQNCPTDYISKLESILAHGILTNCLKQTSHTSVMVWAVRLIQALSLKESLYLKLCTKSDSCPFIWLHRVSTNENFAKGNCDATAFYKEYIYCLSTVISEQRQGLEQLLTSSCGCSSELVPGLILSLYKLYQVYKHDKLTKIPSKKRSNNENSGLLFNLAQGITLLHTVAQANANFVQRHIPVQSQFICLLSGLRTELKAKPEAFWEVHLTALEELYDFEPDLCDDMSQGSDNEDRMDPT